MKKFIYLFTILLFLLLVILPLFSIVFGSFIKNGSFTLENYFDIFNKRTLFLLSRSAGLAFSVAVLSTLIGGFFAFVLTKTNLPFKKFFKLIITTK